MTSVVIPSYNCAEFLPEAIESALGQTLRPLEVIVVDDGSTDETRNVVASFARLGPVRYIFQSNRGLPAARNAGLLHARGRYFAALDADDRLAATALEEMTAAVATSGASWCVSDVLRFWGDQSERRQMRTPPGAPLLGILREDFITRGMFFKREVLLRLGMWDEHMKNREDWDLNIRLIEAGEAFVYVDKALYHYRRRAGSITTSGQQKMRNYTRRILEKHHKRLADAGDPQIRKIYAANLWSLAREYSVHDGDFRQAAGCARESLKYDFDARRLSSALMTGMLRGLGGAPAVASK